MRTRNHEVQERSMVHREDSGEQSERQTDDKSRSNRNWHCGTIHHRITEASKGAQYGTLKIPPSAKVTNDASGYVSEVSCLGRGVPQTFTDAFSNGAPGGSTH
ncbi:hypothetical protein CDL15_Pgr003920 [Punica granatum]|uniref:Uncharacterized protein n=1 Tax=Punica granatum TaxID=22663 RepID=A0A218WA03_PUNGR|nr:hypothetical protein CDL15_Pgr003920 [Punica granatum]